MGDENKNRASQSSKGSQNRTSNKAKLCNYCNKNIRNDTSFCQKYDIPYHPACGDMLQYIL